MSISVVRGTLNTFSDMSPCNVIAFVFLANKIVGSDHTSAETRS